MEYYKNQILLCIYLYFFKKAPNILQSKKSGIVQSPSWIRLCIVMPLIPKYVFLEC